MGRGLDPFSDDEEIDRERYERELGRRDLAARIGFDKDTSGGVHPLRPSPVNEGYFNREGRKSVRMAHPAP